MDLSTSPTDAKTRGRRSTSHTLLLTTGFGGLLFILVFVILGVLAPGYDSLHQAISALEFTTFSIGQRANFLVFGLLLCCFAAALRRELTPGRCAFLIPLFQIFSGIAVIGDAVFIYEPLHTICDLVAFNSTMLVLYLFAWRFLSEPAWKGWSVYSIVTAIVMMAFLAAFGIANHLGGPAGLFEKLATGTRTVWSVLLTAKLLSGRRLGPV
jgi:hypothetical protein